MEPSLSNGAASAEALGSDAGKPASGRAEHVRRWLTRRIIGGALVAALAVVALTVATIWRLHQEQLASGMSAISGLDRLAAAQTMRAFDTVVMTLDDIATDLDAEGFASSAALRQAKSGAATYRLLRARMAHVPQLAALALVAAGGEVINGTRRLSLSQPLNIAKRDYFLRLRDHPELTLFVSRPVRSRRTGNRVIYIGRRLSAPNGAFLGLLTGAIRLPYLEGLYARDLNALAGGDKVIALWRSDGTLLVRVPAASGAPAVAPDETAAAPARTALAAFWGKDRHGSVAVARQRLKGFPLIAEARQSAASIAAQRHGLIIATAISGGALLGLIGLASALLLQQLRAAALVSEERARADRESEAREDMRRAMAKAETAMREAQQSEARFRDIAEVGSDWIWETDAQHRLTFIAGARQPRSDLFGKTRWEVTRADLENDEPWRLHKADLDARRPFRQFRFPVDTPDGRLSWFCASGKPVFDDDGTFVGYRGTVADETELVAARERAERADALLRNAIDSIAEGFVIYDAEDRFVMCNEAYRKMYPENPYFVPGARYEDVMRAAAASGRYPDAIGHEEEWVARWLRQHREAAEPEEIRMSDGRWILRSERRMRDGSIAGLRIDITALKNTQASLRESQVMLNRAQRLTATGSIWRNFRTGKVEWSDETYRIFGVTRETFTPGNEKFLGLIHPDDRARLSETVAAADSGLPDTPFHFRIVRPDGAVRIIYRESVFWRDADGSPMERLATYRDVTEQHAAEARQHELEAMLRDAIDSLSEGFAFFDRDDRLVICNEAYKRVYPASVECIVPGISFEQMLRQSLARGEYRGAAGHEEKWLAERLAEHRDLTRSSFELPLGDGRWILVSERRTSSGGTAGLRVDITALKKVQQSLRESREQLDRTQRIAHIGTVERDLKTTAVVWSDETYRIFGVTRENYMPSTDNLLEIVHPDDRPLLRAAFRRRFAEHANKSMKFRILRPDGEIRTLLAQADSISDESGKPHFISVAMMDVTEKELAARRQVELEMQLRHSEKLTALGTLAGGIAHDLNNTLVPIQALTKLAMREFPAGAPLRDDLETVYQASIKARDLVRQILAFSRKQGRADASIDLGATVREALSMLRASLPATIELEERIGPVPRILGDSGQLQQVVVNLVTNAAHAIGAGYGRIAVILEAISGDASRRGRAVRLSILDTGCGMTHEVMQRIFEPFFTTKGVGEGTGLGLSVVHGIVTDHGGTIDVKSTPDHGSQFVILLPAKAAEPREVAAVA